MVKNKFKIKHRKDGTFDYKAKGVADDGSGYNIKRTGVKPADAPRPELKGPDAEINTPKTELPKPLGDGTRRSVDEVGNDGINQQITQQGVDRRNTLGNPDIDQPVRGNKPGNGEGSGRDINNGGDHNKDISNDGGGAGDGAGGGAGDGGGDVGGGAGGGAGAGEGLAWFATNWKTIAIVAGSAALIAAIVKLIKHLNKQIKVRYNKCVRTLQRAQKDFTIAPDGLNMKNVMPGVGSKIFDRIAGWFNRGAKKASSNGNIGLHPFCQQYKDETAQDFRTAQEAFNKIRLASDEAGEATETTESFNGRRVYESFYEALAEDAINEGEQLNEIGAMAAISTAISLGGLAVKAGTFLFQKMKGGKPEGEAKAIQVTKQSTREICYAIINNYASKYVNMEQVFKQLGIASNSLADLDASSCDKLAEILKKYQKPEPNAYTKQYARIQKAYENMLKHYFNIGDGIIKNFVKYTKADNEKDENLLVASKEKLQNMWDSQKEFYTENFSRIVIEIVSSDAYIGYLNFIVEKVIPVFKSGLAGDADYILDVMPKKGEYYVLRQTGDQPWLENGEQQKGQIAIAEVEAFDRESKEITFNLIGLLKDPKGFTVNDNGIAEVTSEVDLEAYKDGDKPIQEKLAYGKWISLDPAFTEWRAIGPRSDAYVYVNNKGVKFIAFAAKDMDGNDGYNTMYVGVVNPGMSGPSKVVKIELTSNISDEGLKIIFDALEKFDKQTFDVFLSKLASAITAFTGETEEEKAGSTDEVIEIIKKLLGDEDEENVKIENLYTLNYVTADDKKQTMVVFAKDSGEEGNNVKEVYIAQKDADSNEYASVHKVDMDPELVKTKYAEIFTTEGKIKNNNDVVFKFKSNESDEAVTSAVLGVESPQEETATSDDELAEIIAKLLDDCKNGDEGDDVTVEGVYSLKYVTSEGEKQTMVVMSKNDEESEDSIKHIYVSQIKDESSELVKVYDLDMDPVLAKNLYSAIFTEEGKIKNEEDVTFKFGEGGVDEGVIDSIDSSENKEAQQAASDNDVIEFISKLLGGCKNNDEEDDDKTVEGVYTLKYKNAEDAKQMLIVTSVADEESEDSLKHVYVSQYNPESNELVKVYDLDMDPVLAKNLYSAIFTEEGKIKNEEDVAFKFNEGGADDAVIEEISSKEDKEAQKATSDNDVIEFISNLLKGCKTDEEEDDDKTVEGVYSLNYKDAEEKKQMLIVTSVVDGDSEDSLKHVYVSQYNSESNELVKVYDLEMDPVLAKNAYSAIFTEEGKIKNEEDVAFKFNEGGVDENVVDSITSSENKEAQKATSDNDVIEFISNLLKGCKNDEEGGDEEDDTTVDGVYSLNYKNAEDKKHIMVVMSKADKDNPDALKHVYVSSYDVDGKEFTAAYDVTMDPVLAKNVYSAIFTEEGKIKNDKDVTFKFNEGGVDERLINAISGMSNMDEQKAASDADVIELIVKLLSGCATDEEGGDDDNNDPYADVLKKLDEITKLLEDSLAKNAEMLKKLKELEGYAGFKISVDPITIEIDVKGPDGKDLNIVVYSLVDDDVKKTCYLIGFAGMDLSTFAVVNSLDIKNLTDAINRLCNALSKKEQLKEVVKVIGKGGKTSNKSTWGNYEARLKQVGKAVLNCVKFVGANQQNTNGQNQQGNGQTPNGQNPQNPQGATPQNANGQNPQQNANQQIGFVINEAGLADLKKLGVAVEVQNPKGGNDKMQWLHIRDSKVFCTKPDMTWNNPIVYSFGVNLDAVANAKGGAVECELHLTPEIFIKVSTDVFKAIDSYQFAVRDVSVFYGKKVADAKFLTANDYKKLDDKKKQKWSSNEGVKVTYSHKVVNESMATDTVITRKFNKSFKNLYVLSESYFDLGMDTSKLSNPSIMKTFKTRSDVFGYVKNHMDAKIFPMTESQTYKVSSYNGYRPSLMTPLYENVYAVRFSDDDKVTGIRYLGKFKIQ